MTTDKKIIAILAQDNEMGNYLKQYLPAYKSFHAIQASYSLLFYSSLPELINDMKIAPGYAGFLIAVKMLSNSDPLDRIFLNYLMENFPYAHISISREKKIIGSIDSISMESEQFFDAFFKEVENFEKASEKMNIVLIVDDKDSQFLYESELSVFPRIAVQHFPSPRDFLEKISKENRYRGFIIDLRSIIRANPADKVFIYELIESFPVIRITHTPDRKVIKGNIRDKNIQGKELFDYFVDEACHRFSPRGIRSKKRKNLFLNAQVEIEKKNSQKEIFKTNTLNVSEEGLFIISTLEVNEGDVFNLIISEFSDKQPIQCIVKWIQPWGSTAKKLPGFGGAFASISPTQQKELMSFLAGPSINLQP